MTCARSRSRSSASATALAWTLASSLLWLAGCGGGDLAPPPPSVGQATLGAAGGTVEGPDGVTLTVPTDAIASDMTLRVARDSTNAPPLPEDLGPLSAVYSFTPHGLMFGDTVQARIPFDAAKLASGEQPAFMYAQPGGRWTMIVNDVAEQSTALTAPLMGFSWGYVADLGPTGSSRYPMSLSLVSPTPASLPMASTTNSFRRLTQAQTIRLHAELAPYMTQQGRAGSCVSTATLPTPRLELVRVVGPWPMATPVVQPTGGITLPGAPVVGTAYGHGADFDVPMDASHNGTAYFLVRLYCARGHADGSVDHRTETDPMQFGFVVLRVDIPRSVDAPTIAQQPQDVTVVDGNRAEFRVMATAPDTLAIQWQRSDDGGITWSNTAVTGGAYTFAPAVLADDGVKLRAEVCNQRGVTLNCITSSVATLTVASVTVAPVFSQQPQPLSVVEGQTASFTVVVSATPAPTIRWYREAVGGPTAGPATEVGGPCTGSANPVSCGYTTPALTQADSGARFFAIATNGTDNTMSSLAEVTVLSAAVAPSLLSGEPADVSVTVGQSATFSVNAGGTAPLSYQWYRDGTAITGFNAPSYTVANAQLADSGHRFRVTITNAAGTVTSRDATLTVTAPAVSAGACTAGAGSGWCWTRPLPHSNPIAALVFDGGNTLAFGDAGTRMVSTDDGIHWQTSFGGWSSRDSIRDTVAPTSGVVVAAAGDGVWRSGDGGQSWTHALDTGAIGAAVQSLAFRDASHGVAVGAGLWRTSDGGGTWTQVASPPGDPFLYRVAISGGAYVAVGTGGTILRSTDQGATWSDVGGSLSTELIDVAFDGAGHGVALGSGTQYLVTGDGGLSWTVADFGGVPGLAQAVAFPAQGKAVVLFNSAWVLQSVDGGATWDAGANTPAWQSAGYPNNLRLKFKDANLGVAAGDYGTVARTVDGGQSWTLVSGGGYYDRIDAVRMGAGGLGLAAGVGSSVWRTTDGGATWSAFQIADPTSPGGDLRMVEDIAFAGATAWATSAYGRVYRSDDGGQNWTVAFLEGGRGDFNFEGVDFASSTTGVVVGWNRSGDGVMRRTTDGGQQWSAVSLPVVPALKTVRFGSSTLGLAAGGSTLLRTTDGGQTWAAVTLSSLNPAGEGIEGVAFASSTDVVIATDLGLHRSTDGGLTWTRVAGGPGNPIYLYGVAFGDANTGVAVGERLLRTTDGGASWSSVGGGVGTVLYAAAFASPSTVFAVGDGGALLRNTQAGLGPAAP